VCTAGSIRSPMRTQFGVVVPIRTFALGNTRLASVLDDETRTALAIRLADRVVDAARPAPVIVVTSAPEVATWAQEHNADVIADPGSLNAAAASGAAALVARGCRRVVIAHADLPLVRSFAPVTRDAGQQVAVVVPCHRDDGTPVLSLPALAVPEFEFAYGLGSFRRHVTAAKRAGLGVRVVRDAALAFDVDTVDDLAALSRYESTTITPERA
jgi:2-phospho-L-lactate/phosphoenolpyruvate guanylyltransferase